MKMFSMVLTKNDCCFFLFLFVKNKTNKNKSIKNESNEHHYYNLV